MLRARLLPLLVVPLLALAAVGDLAADAPRATAASPRYLHAASTAYKRANLWWDSRRDWYRERLHGARLASLWGVVHLFGATSALAIADPTAARRAAVRTFAHRMERYWNPDLKPAGGYVWYPGGRGTRALAFFDDNGWLGIAYYDAYRATGDRRYLRSASHALAFIDRAGWDRRHGGIWWDTRHSFHAGESLGTGTLLAASLYKATHDRRYLAIANRYIRWADADFRGSDGLYDRNERDDTPMAYVQGPMAEAFALLCRTARRHGYCDEAEELADRTAARFPMLTMGPQYDAMYVRSLLQLYRLDRDPRRYDAAVREVSRAMANARLSNGLYLLTWDGRLTASIGTPARMLQTHAATTSAVAWMAAVPR